MIRIPYTSYGFTPPKEPLTEAQYDELRELSDPQFNAQLKQAKRIAGREGWIELWGECKFLLLFLVFCGALITGLEIISKTSKIIEYINSGVMIIATIGLFGIVYSSLASIMSSSRFVSDLGKFIKNQRKAILLSANYASYLSSQNQESRRTKK